MPTARLAATFRRGRRESLLGVTFCPWRCQERGSRRHLARSGITALVILGVLAVAAFGAWLLFALVVAVVRPGQQGSQPDAKKAALFWCPARVALRRRLLDTLATCTLKTLLI